MKKKTNLEDLLNFKKHVGKTNKQLENLKLIALKKKYIAGGWSDQEIEEKLAYKEKNDNFFEWAKGKAKKITEH